ncbi:MULTISPECIES: amino acid ABC transporter permease [Pandoraea]|uniref:Amino acid ABC transporter n=1 Tax=Pandoraea thiooxydans TaxID=445709 RepID=A0A0G3ETF4_9BURK|nr:MULTISPECIES: amino acid ABC transporter permease [Pandoraea]AKJ67951.1 amino acid ABC transporter [Pandoraea thiooxydans]APR95164.1 amino acid ABC transporter [Pandoraea thiooxydans]TAL53545.1 MAG: amino acid ABC transporter permease [Pandoraea sp.]TAM14913.1 MAG: amino acid ABC transporter permease [Pandoraea sp.]
MSGLTTFVQSMPLLAHAAISTIWISLLSLFIGFFIGTGVCAARLSRHAVLRWIGGVYVGVFRGVPMLVQLLVAYYCLPFIGINVPPLVAAVGTASLCTASYIAEIMRGGFLGIPAGQLEAARVLGMSWFDMLVRIQVPQALRLTLPALVNEMILLLKASSLISVVGVEELTRTAQNVAASTFEPLPAYLGAAVIYLCINGVLALAGQAAERRLKIA